MYTNHQNCIYLLGLQTYLTVSVNMSMFMALVCKTLMAGCISNRFLSPNTRCLQSVSKAKNNSPANHNTHFLTFTVETCCTYLDHLHKPSNPGLFTCLFTSPPSCYTHQRYSGKMLLMGSSVFTLKCWWQGGFPLNDYFLTTPVRLHTVAGLLNKECHVIGSPRWKLQKLPTKCMARWELSSAPASSN